MSARLVSVAALGVVLVASWRRATPDITESALRERLTTLAHDSMQGRLTGSAGLDRATSYVVAELARAHVAPAGVAGTYFQSVPLVRRQLDLAHARATDNGLYIPGVDFLPIVGAFGLGTPDSVNVRRGTYVPAGQLGAHDALPPSEVEGAFPVFLAPFRANRQSDYQLWDYRALLATYARTPAIFIASLDLMPRSFIAAMSAPRIELRTRVAAPPRVPPIIALTRGAAHKAVGSVNRSISYTTRESPVAARNIVAVVEGSDPALKHEFVVLSAHLDHLGIADSSQRLGTDSVFNGANAGSGAAALVALAEYFEAQPVKPKRSLVFLWTVGSAQGLLGAEFFSDSPTIARDSIVAALAVDVLGGATAAEVRGARSLSAELGDVIDAAAREVASVLTMRASTAADDRAPRARCDGDEWHFARWGIPSARISTGERPADNRVSDEVSAIDFAAYARVASFVGRVAEHIANAPARPRVDQPKPDPRAICAR